MKREETSEERDYWNSQECNNGILDGGSKKRK